MLTYNVVSSASLELYSPSSSNRLSTHQVCPESLGVPESAYIVASCVYAVQRTSYTAHLAWIFFEQALVSLDLVHSNRFVDEGQLFLHTTTANNH